MAGGEEKSRYELLEISDPSTLLVRGKLDGMIILGVILYPSVYLSLFKRIKSIRNLSKLNVQYSIKQ